MHASRPTLMLALLCASSSWAQTSQDIGLCHDSTSQDRQPNFAALDFKDISSVSLTKDNPPALRLDTNLEELNPERIYFPFAQQVRVSFMYEAAGNSTALGYFYYKDLVARGYINPGARADDSSDDTLADKDGNGIADFHQDLFQMTSTSSIASDGRRCNNTFDYRYNNKTNTLYIPEIATRDCANKPFTASTSVPSASPYPYPLPRGVTRPNITVATVGEEGSAGNTDHFSDRGLYGSVPNLLEPSDPKNKMKGIGHIIFLHSDDDGDNATGGNLGPVSDSSTRLNGIPDYNVSTYDADGRRLANVPATDLMDQENDRTVNLGEIEGDQELVFFIVSWGAASHNPGGASSVVHPCLSFKSGTPNTCALHLKTPTNVYFSKTFLNLDQNPRVPVNLSVAERDIGCPYKEDGSTCKLGLPGWLDAYTLNNLKNEPAYNNLVMPNEKAVVKSDTSGRSLMPHVLVGAPSTDKFRWVLGFEDLPGGGDRDFNDVSFMIHKSNGGKVRSAVVSGDLSPSIAQDYTITEVTFGAEDESYFASNGNSNFCATRKAEDRPRIRYQVALDCKVCKSNCGTSNPVMEVNANPNWVDVPLGEPPANGKRNETVTIRDFLERSLTGSQLCWQSIMESKYDECQPTIKNINVFYKAVKAGDYGRAAVSTVANTVLYGTFETPGRNWFQPNVAQPSVRAVDGRPDLAERGHLYLKELFVPEKPTKTTGTRLWDSGDKLASTLRLTKPEPNDWRKLITLSPEGKRAELKDVFFTDKDSESFSGTNCGGNNGGRWDCDLDASGGSPNDADRQLLRDWLYGWERRTGTPSTDVRRTWAMGGVQLSTPAIIGNASSPGWLARARGEEQSAFDTNFIKDKRVSERTTMAYVGSTQGFFHGVKAGSLMTGDDKCTSVREANGYFKVTGSCSPTSTATFPRDYGEATEAFAYLPRKLLPYYVASYRRQGNGKRASTDASPSVADVDLGFGTYNPTTGFPKTSSKDAWKIGEKNKVGPNEGAKTVIVSATGPSHSVVYSLDITDPTSTTFPQPMWEFDMAADTVDFGGKKGNLTVEDAFNDIGKKANASLRLPDTRGSRHSPPLVRMDFGTAGQRWVAVVGTDYIPNNNTSGTVYLLDMKTGAPVQVPGGQDAARVAGVIPLAVNEGIGGEPAAVDANEDGNAELIYVATTKGKIYRIATHNPDASREFGRVMQVCLLADVQKALSKSTKSEYKQEAPYQGVYSSMSVQLNPGTNGKTVRLFVGTANNPDIANEPADLLPTPPHGYILAFEDAAPTGTSCNTKEEESKLLAPLWIKQLGAGQMVWGGLTLAQSKDDTTVTTATAVGKAANACELSSKQSGMIYSVSAKNPEPDKQAVGTSLNGHSLATPVLHDGHMIMLTADGKVLVRGDPNGWNTGAGNTEPGRVRVHMWDADPSGVLKP